VCCDFSTQIVTNDAKIVFRNMRELWAAGAFPNGPNPCGARLQSIIDTNVTAAIQLDTGLLEANFSSVRNAPSRDQDVAAIKELTNTIRNKIIS